MTTSVHPDPGAPKVGAIVLYRPNSDPSSYHAGPFPALVIRCNADSTLNLAVFRDDVSMEGWVEGCVDFHFNVGAQGGTWPDGRWEALP